MRAAESYAEGIPLRQLVVPRQTEDAHTALAQLRRAARTIPTHTEVRPAVRIVVDHLVDHRRDLRLGRPVDLHKTLIRPPDETLKHRLVQARRIRAVGDLACHGATGVNRADLQSGRIYEEARKVRQADERNGHHEDKAQRDQIGWDGSQCFHGWPQIMLPVEMSFTRRMSAPMIMCDPIAL